MSGFHAFLYCLEVNVIEQLGFELAYFNVAVPFVGHYATAIHASTSTNPEVERCDIGRFYILIDSRDSVSAINGDIVHIKEPKTQRWQETGPEARQGGWRGWGLSWAGEDQGRGGLVRDYVTRSNYPDIDSIDLTSSDSFCDCFQLKFYLMIRTDMTIDLTLAVSVSVCLFLFLSQISLFPFFFPPSLSLYFNLSLSIDGS